MVWLVVLVVLVGALTRATFGFGEAVVAMPLLPLLPIGLPTAASQMGLVGLTIAVVSLLGGLGSAYSFHGIPVVVYATLRVWSPEVFRGTLQACFLVSGALVVAGQAIGRLWSEDRVLLALTALPAVGLAVLLGRVLHARMPAHRFHHYVHLLVVVLGLVLLVKVLAG